MANNTIVFGPTGGVGSAAARFAHKKGAKVYLAMRDTSKTIPGLSESEEKAGNYVRVQADLNKPDTVLAVAKESQAKTAFFYLTWGAESALTESIKAMKQGGIDKVVFLSSYSVVGDIRAVPRDHFIPHVHALIEVALEEIYGDGNFTALRPAWFATNTSSWIPEMKQGGPVHELYPDNEVDVIVPGDIGNVGGALLARDTTAPFPRIVYLTGQQLISMRAVIDKIAKANGKDIQLVEIGEDEKLKRIVDHGLPEPVAKYLVNSLREARDGTGIMQYKGPEFEEGQRNVKEYTREAGTTVDQWIAENKGMFV